jgi:sensor histidine kinase YesM
MILAAVAFGTFVVVMGAVLTWFSVITKQTLYAITEYFNRLAESDWDTPDLNTPPYREFSLISQTANRMKKEIRNSITEIENRAKLEKQLSEERLINEKQKRMLVSAQMSALRAQVNPHFLFNSLNLIGVTALVGDSKTVMQMVEATGKILRYSLYHQESMTTLDEELEIVLQYLFLQKSRFGDKVKTEIYNELEGEKILIPTMSIQAIVENCFKHGFGNKKSLYIHISVICDDENISICVMDDGVGFVPEQKLDENKGGIGLSNIKKRMELLYGKENAGIDIESEPGKYTSVTLRIPVKEASCENSDS